MSAGPDNAANLVSAAGATSLSLLAKAQANQPQAWERLVDLYAPLVYHWCRRWQLSADDTADVFQEVFRSVAEHIGGFRRDRPGDTFRGWLRAITHNKVRDHFRQCAGRAVASGGSDAQRRILDLPDPAVDDPEEQTLVQRQLYRALEAIRADFESQTWTAFWQVQVEGHQPGDVATKLGMTPAAVRKAKYRVLQRLREELGELME